MGQVQAGSMGLFTFWRWTAWVCVSNPYPAFSHRVRLDSNESLLGFPDWVPLILPTEEIADMEVTQVCGAHEGPYRSLIRDSEIAERVFSHREPG